jgi:hypothetical protein
MRRLASLLVAVIATLGAACASPPAERPIDAVDDGAAAGNDVVADTTPTAPIPDEGPPSPPTDAGDGSAVTPPPTPPLERPKVDPIQVTIWNRFLVKPTDKGMPETEIRRLVEESVGAPVVTLRRTAVGYWLVQLAPAEPPRGRAEQQAVIDTLKKTGAFAVVEGDQIMTIK